MYIAFKTDYTPEMDKLLKDFENPPGVISNLVHQWLYGNKEIYKFPEEKIVIIYAEGIIPLYAKFYLGNLLLLALMAFLFQFGIFAHVFLIMFAVCFLIISDHVHYFQFKRNLRKYGHKAPVKMLNLIDARIRRDASAGKSL